MEFDDEDDVYEAFRAQLDGAKADDIYDKLKTAFASPVEGNSVKFTVDVAFNDTQANGWVGENISAAFLALKRDHPELPWANAKANQMSFSGRDTETQVTLSLTGVPGVTWNKASFEKQTGAAAAAVKIVDTMSDAEKIKAIHDYLCGAITYNQDAADDDDNADWVFQTAYSAFMPTTVADEEVITTVCAGYASAFKLLCDKFKIPCVYVSGTAGGGGHAWNYVQIEDEWYAVDTTWDDQEKKGISTDFFLVGSTTPAGKGWQDVAEGTVFSTSHVASGQWSTTAGVPAFPYPGLADERYDITPKIELTVEGTPTAASVEYGSTLATATLSWDDVTVKAGEETVNGTWEWEDDTQLAGTVAGPNAFAAVFTPGTEAEKYEKLTAQVSVTVTAKELTITGLTAESRAYNGTTAVKLKGGVLSGIVGEDDVSVNIPQNGTISSEDASDTDYTVDLSALALDGADKGNYTLTIPTVTVKISKKTPEITKVSLTNPEAAIYETTNPTDVLLTGTGTDAGVGTFAFAAGTSFSEAVTEYDWVFTPDADNEKNYTTTTGKITVAVQSKPVKSISVNADGLEKSEYKYGEPFDPTGLAITVTFEDDTTDEIVPTNADITYTVGDGEDKVLGGVGEKTVVVTYKGKSADITGITVIQNTIAAATLEWSGDEFVYDGSKKTVTISTEITGVTFTYENHEKTYAGTYKATATAEIENPDNVAVSGNLEHTWSIKAATQNPTIESTASVSTGKTLNLSGLITGAAEGSEITFALAADETKATCEGSILTAGTETGEVTVTVSIEALDVNDDGTPEYKAFPPEGDSATITVTIQDKDVPELQFEADAAVKTYGNAAFTNVLTGAGDAEVTYTSSDETVATVNAQGKVTIVGAGNATITASVAETETTAAAEKSYPLTVNPATITITAENKSAYIGDAAPTPTYTVSGLVGGDELATEPTAEYASDPDMSVAGTTEIKVSGAEASDNYEIVYVSGTLTVTRRPSSSSSSSGGSSGGSSSGSGSTTTTSGNGTTTTTTTSSNGTVTETTKRTDGSETVVVTKPDGTVTTTDRESDGTTTKTVENPDGSSETTLTQPDGTSAVTKVDEDGKTESAVKVSEKTIDSSDGDPVALPIPAVRPTDSSATAPVVTVTLPSGSTAAVEVPVRGVTAGTVAVIVSPTGVETVIKTSAITGDGVAFTVSGEMTVKIMDRSKPFGDVASSDWHKNAVDFATARGLFNGTSANTFTPDGVMTRGMIATVLYNLENNPAVPVGASFSDVKSGEWYADGVQWAAGRGLISGYGNGKLGPEDPITREQLAIILWNYAGSPMESGSLSFGDASTVSGYAQAAMLWATRNGIISGSNGMLNPSAQASRAQVAQMLMNFVNTVM